MWIRLLYERRKECKKTFCWIYVCVWSKYEKWRSCCIASSTYIHYVLIPCWVPWCDLTFLFVHSVCRSPYSVPALPFVIHIRLLLLLSCINCLKCIWAFSSEHIRSRRVVMSTVHCYPYCIQCVLKYELRDLFFNKADNED